MKTTIACSSKYETFHRWFCPWPLAVCALWWNFSSPASAATIIDWKADAATSNWATGTNWEGDNAPINDLIEHIARFNQTSYVSQPNAGMRSIHGIHIGDGTNASAALTLSGANLTIGDGGITKFANSGTADLSSPITLGAAQTWANNSGTLLTISGTVANGGHLLTLGGSSNGTITNIISGVGGLTKTGDGKWVLIADNTYTGLTTVSKGVLEIGDGIYDPGTGSTNFLGRGNYSIEAGAQLVFNRNRQSGLRFTNQAFSGAGDVVLAGGSRGFYTMASYLGGAASYSGASSTHTGKVIVNMDAALAETAFSHRALWLEQDDVFAHSAVLDLQSGKVIFRNQTNKGITTAGLMGNAGTYITTDRTDLQKLTADVADGQTHTYAGVIGKDSYAQLNNNVSFTKKGAGTQVLTGLNTYTGTTQVQGGNLQIGVNGAGQTGAGNVIVSTAAGQSLAVLSGTGNIRGAATVTDGVVRPGDLGGANVGALFFQSDLTFNPTSDHTVAEFTILDATAADYIAVDGTFTLNEHSLFSVSLDDSYIPLEGHNWQIMDWGGLTLNGFTVGSNLRSSGYGGGNLYLQELDGYLWDIQMSSGGGFGSLILSIVAVPEPSRVLLLLAGLGLCCLRRRR